MDATMPVEMKYEPDGVCMLRISGILKRSEFGAEQNALASCDRSTFEPCGAINAESMGFKRSRVQIPPARFSAFYDQR
jgi:hypothetical protein